MKAKMIALATTLCANLATAADLHVSGSLAGVAAQGNENFRDSQSVPGANGKLQIEAKPSDAFALKLNAEHSTDRNLGVINSGPWIREATMRYSQDAIDVTLGRQLLPSGKTDLITLQDQFVPRDLTQQGMTDIEQRLGLPALRVDAYLNDVWTLTGALIRQDRSYILPFKTQRAVPGWRTLADDPADGGLVRLGYRQGIWEWEAGTSWGASPLPAIRTSQDGATHIGFAREHRLFADGTITLGGGVLRWDVVKANTAAENYPGLPTGHWAVALGWDQGLWSDANFTGQWIYRRDQFPDNNNPALAPIVAANQQLSQAFQPKQQWITASLKQRINDNHDVEITLIAGSNHQRGAIGRWNWRVTDGWTFGMRAQTFSGESNSLLESMTPKRQLYVELRHYFDWR